ncbi:MAG: carboxypeptidase-like regulatory domain-containing protein, partial [Acidobacteriota bacterium]|nr:carboxypeptidase-like regulatory domain-containing protein [Acidobacteriota bacterium]
MQLIDKKILFPRRLQSYNSHRSLFYLLAVLFVSTPICAQQTSQNPTALRVTVTDAEQRALPGASVQLFNSAPAPVATAVTNERGVAEFQEKIPAATYRLR